MTAPATSLASIRPGMLRRIGAWIFGAVFIFAGAVKLRDPGLFGTQVRSFDMLPDPYNAFLALGLPWVELLCGLAVLTGLLRLGGLLLLDLCLLAFLGVLGWALVRGKEPECGCFGSVWQAGTRLELALDGVLLALGIWLLLFWSRTPQHE